MRLTLYTTLAVCLALVGSASAADDLVFSLSDEMVQPASFGSDQKSGADQKSGGADQKSDCKDCGSKGGGKGGKGGCSCYRFGPDEAYSLSSGCNRFGVKVGGWTQFGYHSRNSYRDGFNQEEDDLNLHQQWIYAERAADGSCGWGWGFRFDAVYGIDGGDTQSFGNGPGVWDFQNGFDHGAYAWAIPQAYVELAKGDLSVKVGHFYTLIGYEVVTAPDNFFYSHAYTMNNSEPFTHTGAIATYAMRDNLTVYGGWTSGWDTGFDQFANGSSWLGGVSFALCDNATLTYMSTYGDFGEQSDGASDSYSHSIVIDVALSDRLNYILQSDMLQLNDAANQEDVGINQYLIYTVNDCWGVGGRVEWWKRDGVSYNAATFGVNYRPHANLVLRPEVKQEWTPNLGVDQTIFGMDAILSY
jgi:hypothetical protein